MNINGRYYCSRCLTPLPDETVCSFCGHDPEEAFDSHFMEEGTLLSGQRYRVGVIIKEDYMFSFYGGWDYLSNKAVLIKELFPKDMISRNTLSTDIAIVPSDMRSLYDKMVGCFVDISTDEKLMCGVIDSFICNDFGYHILNYNCLFTLL